MDITFSLFWMIHTRWACSSRYGAVLHCPQVLSLTRILIFSSTSWQKSPTLLLYGRSKFLSACSTSKSSPAGCFAIFVGVWSYSLPPNGLKRHLSLYFSARRYKRRGMQVEMRRANVSPFSVSTTFRLPFDLRPTWLFSLYHFRNCFDWRCHSESVLVWFSCLAWVLCMCLVIRVRAAVVDTDWMTGSWWQVSSEQLTWTTSQSIIHVRFLVYWSMKKY